MKFSAPLLLFVLALHTPIVCEESEFALGTMENIEMDISTPSFDYGPLDDAGEIGVGDGLIDECSIPVVLQEEELYHTCPISYCPCPRPLIFYVGAEGGWAIGLTDKTGFGGGALFNGPSFDARARSGYMVGANVGCRFNSLFRSDLSYTFLREPYRWTALSTNNNFPLSFSSTLRSHLFLLNGYLNLNSLFCLCPGWDPYVGVGLGVAVNQLRNVQEFTSLNSQFVADINNGNRTNFAARFGLGITRCLWRRTVLDLAFNANYIGQVHTGNARTLSTGQVGPIGIYRFRNNWIGTISLGLKYLF